MSCGPSRPSGSLYEPGAEGRAIPENRRKLRLSVYSASITLRFLRGLREGAFRRSHPACASARDLSAACRQRSQGAILGAWHAPRGGGRRDRASTRDRVRPKTTPPQGGRPASTDCRRRARANRPWEAEAGRPPPGIATPAGGRRDVEAPAATHQSGRARMRLVEPDHGVRIEENHRRRRAKPQAFRGPIPTPLPVRDGSVKDFDSRSPSGWPARSCRNHRESKPRAAPFDDDGHAPLGLIQGGGQALPDACHRVPLVVLVHLHCAPDSA